MNISNFQQCSNCGACYNICPKGAISIIEEEIFYTPKIDGNLCIDCSLCTQVCPVNQQFKKNEPICAYAGWNKQNSVVFNSSSGGVFHGLAEYVLSNGGVVFAAVYSDDCKTVKFASSDDVQLDKMLKSKYVESLVDLSFQKIKNELALGRMVLFCGTPCQVAGLHSYLGKEYDCLFTCDFACGGLPSHKVYNEYIGNLERIYSSAANIVDFRPKSHGWKRHAIRVKFENGKEYLRLGTEDPYLRSFLYGKYTVRNYCLECKFAENHTSDITIADFWLYEKFLSNKQDKGISLILCNTTKGKNIIDSIREKYIITELDVEQASYNNHIQISGKKIKKHNEFLDFYIKHGFALAHKKYLPIPFRENFKSFIIRKFFKKKRNF